MTMCVGWHTTQDLLATKRHNCQARNCHALRIEVQSRVMTVNYHVIKVFPVKAKPKETGSKIKPRKTKRTGKQPKPKNYSAIWLENYFYTTRFRYLYHQKILITFSIIFYL